MRWNGLLIDLLILQRYLGLTQKQLNILGIFHSLVDTFSQHSLIFWESLQKSVNYFSGDMKDALIFVLFWQENQKIFLVLACPG